MAIEVFKIKQIEPGQNVQDSSCTCNDYYNRGYCIHLISLLVYQKQIEIPRNLLMASNIYSSISIFNLNEYKQVNMGEKGKKLMKLSFLIV